MSELSPFAKEYISSTERALANREIVQETPFQKFWTQDLATKWAKELPEVIEEEPKETPIHTFDLSDLDLGVVMIKDESDRSVNPTGTMKDRVARIIAMHYEIDSRHELECIVNDPQRSMLKQEVLVPRFSLLTSGNAGMALASSTKKFELPPIKLLFDKNTNNSIIEAVKKQGADIYLTDLTHNPFSGKLSTEDPLNAWQIKFLTNNERGRDLTSSGGGYIPLADFPQIFYSRLAYDVFKEHPEEVYAPFGGGVLMGDLLATQYIYREDVPDFISEKDPKELALGDRVSYIKILGAEPEDLHSIADKLTAPVKPFIPYDQERLQYLIDNHCTDMRSGVYKISEEEIKEAWEIMKTRGKNFGMRTEASGAAGLALYIKRKRAGMVRPDSKIVIINSGCGIVNEKPE